MTEAITTSVSTEALLIAALHYLLGFQWSVIPLGGDKKPVAITATKLFEWEAYQDNLPTEAQVRQWFTHYPVKGVGIVCGPISGLFALDCDIKTGGDLTLMAWSQKGWKLPDGPTVKTGGGGLHAYMQLPRGIDIPNIPKLGQGVELRAHGSYMAAPPSSHPSGAFYQWPPGQSPDDLPLPAPPDWLLQLIASHAKREATQSKAFKTPEAIPEGERNNTLFKLGASLRHKGLSENEIFAALQVANTERCQPPLSEDELSILVKQAAKYEAGLISNNANKPGFVLIPLANLVAEPEEKVAWRWEKVLPSGGLSILAAKPKVGKSTLARNLALAVAKGQPFLGRATTKGPVVYLALEEKRAEVAAHFTRMGAAEEPVHIHVGVAPEKALEALGQAIRETGAVLAIVDPLLKLVRLRDANDYAEVVRALDPLLQLARNTGCHILAVHHLGKMERDGGDAILGTTALFAAVDTALIMRRRDDARTLESIQRYGEDIPKTALAFDRASGTLEAAGTVEELDMQHIGATILETLSDAEMTEKEIYEGVGGNTGRVAKALRRLLEEGRVTREGGGRKGDPFRYRKILLSPFPYIEKGAKGEKGEIEPTPVASGEWEEEL